MELTKPIYKNGKFENPWETWHKPSLWNLLKFKIRDVDRSNIPSSQELDVTLPLIKLDQDKLQNPDHSCVQLVWIGHATVLVQLDGLTVLCDPIFSDRCSFSQHMGPKRYRAPPCTIQELPHIDVVLISHNHYDHLDLGSVKQLIHKYGPSLHWFVPSGMKAWMINVGCKNVTDLSWWEEEKVVGKQGEITLAFTPTQHWSRRSLNDENKSLWGSWVVKGPNHSFFFAGDTGYCKGFKQIGQKYGPFSLAAIPIGSYEPRWFMYPQHVNPEEAVQIHVDVKSKASVGIHWGTFKQLGCFEHYLEPREKVVTELERQGLMAGSFFTLKHGEVKCITD